MNKKISKKINSIIFDLGGVLFDIDYKYTQQAFQRLGTNTNFDTVYSQQKQAGIFDEFEKGNISPAQFREGLRKWLPSTITDLQIDKAWNALLIGFPMEKIELLKKLKKDYNLFLLSNTNEIHLPQVLQMINTTHSPDIMGELFTKQYYSCQMRLRKPEKVIYEKVLTENSLDPSSTIFIDDSIQNVEGAIVAGLHALHYNPSVDLEDYFLK
jgi:glucose-1-phosphatase